MPNELFRTIKQIIKQTMDAAKLTDIAFGTITSMSPVTVQVDADAKLTLSSEYLIFFDPGHLQLNGTNSSCESGSINADVQANAYYEVGDKVVLIRLMGGNRYLVLGVRGNGQPTPDSGGDLPGGGGASNHNLSQDVLKYEDTVKRIAEKYGMSDYVPLILAIMMQESGGKGTDPMQASECEFNTKYPHTPGAITDPEYSIECGVQMIKKMLQDCGVKSPTDMQNIYMALQCYNYGPGFRLGRADGKWSGCSTWSQEAANAYHNATGEGDNLYVSHVMRYYQVDKSSGSSASGSSNWAKLKAEGEKYLGVPYVFGGSSPSGFDCSGFVSYVYTHSGVKNLPRTTAQGLYDNYCKPINASAAQPGDLVFFQGTYNAGRTITHVGIYAGNGQMLNASGDKVQYTSLNNSYWKAHLYGYGRVV